MNYDFLWAAMVINVTSNIVKILDALDISKGKLFRCLGYSARSSFITKSKGAASALEQNKFYEILRKQSEYNTFSEAQKKSARGKQLLNDINQYFAGVKNRERFADMLIMAIDSFLLFDNKSEDIFKQVAVNAIYNEELVNNCPVYIMGRHVAVIDDILNDRFPEQATPWEEPNIKKKIQEYEGRNTHSIAETEEYARNRGRLVEIQYSKLRAQPWFKMDFQGQRGLSYQFQYFKFSRQRDYNSHGNRCVFEKIMEQKSGILSFITGTGFAKLHPAIPNIVEALFDYQCGDAFWIKGKPVLRLPYSSIYNIYYEEFSTSSLKKYCRLIHSDKVSESDFGSWAIETEPTSYPAQEDIACIESCFRKNKGKCSYLLLFIGNCNEIPLLASHLEPEICKKTIFAAPSSLDASYISFTYQGKTYNYALKIS
ncbi:Uncharacterised protein [uncultured Clostridium sp.]|nr:Uncharacterised protein [uncultured Clostridium sp.]